MRLLLKAAFKNSRHTTLFVLTLVTLVALTLANHMEMFTFGIISSKGTDFFSLFSDKATPELGTRVTWDNIQNAWPMIDPDGKGYVTPADTSLYMSQQARLNPLQYLMYQIEAWFHVSSKSVEAVVILIVFVAVGKAIALFFSRFTTQLLAIRISRDLRARCFEHIQSLPMSFFHKYNIGSLSVRVVGDASQIATSLNSFISNYIHAPFTVVSTLCACFYLSWQLSLVIFVGLPLVALPIILLTKKVKAITRLLQSNREKFSSIIIDFIGGIQTVKIFGMEDFSLQKYQEQNERMASLETKTAKYDLLTRPILHMITSVCLATVLIFGLYILKMSVSQLFVFCGLLYMFYEPVKKFAEENASIQKGIVAAERLFEVLDLKPHIIDSPSAVDLKDFTQSISFNNVWFRYHDTWILKDVSFTVNKGETVAIVGSTGAGKSTIVHLLPRLYDIQEGEICIDGRPITDYTQRSLREAIAFVSQKPFLFYDTVASNIAFGRDFSHEEVYEAANKAHAHDFIAALPQGYDTMLEEMGKNFSGGQQQRLAIARALIKKAPILVLDEATSSLDSLSEKRVQDAIAALRGNVTQIIIAHRLTTIEHADKIIFLEHGQKVAEGTKDELLEQCPTFALMYETHFNQKVTAASMATSHAFQKLP